MVIGVEGRGELPPLARPRIKFLNFFYLPRTIKFGNFEFMFAIRGPTLAKRGIEGKFIKDNIRDLLFYMRPWNDLGG